MNVGCYSGHRVIESSANETSDSNRSAVCIAMSGTDTPERRAAAIIEAVRAIKRGTFASYGEVARRAGLPGRARLVGTVLREAGDDARLPWHRVTGAGGRIAFPAGSRAAREQVRRLAREGVKARGNRVLQRPAESSARTLDALLWKL